MVPAVLQWGALPAWQQPPSSPPVPAGWLGSNPFRPPPPPPSPLQTAFAPPPPPPPPQTVGIPSSGRRLFDNSYPKDSKWSKLGMYQQQKKIADVMLYPQGTEEKLFSLVTRDWLNKAFLASGVGSGLPIRPGSYSTTTSGIMDWQGAKHDPYPMSAYPEVVGMPYKMGRKAAYATTTGSGTGVVKTLPQRLRDSFNDGSLQLPEQCLWYMEMKGNCHDPHFALRSPISGKRLVHPNMAGDDLAFGKKEAAVNGHRQDRHTGLILSRAHYTPLTFSSGVSTDKASRWTGWPSCEGNQGLGSSQRKVCLPEHKCYTCATGYADCNTACADPSVPKGTTGSPESLMSAFNLTGLKVGGGADVCHRAPALMLGSAAKTDSSNSPDLTYPISPKSKYPTNGPYVALQLSVQQHKKDLVTPQLFNVTLTYSRPGVSGPITRSHLLAYETGASIALEQIKGVPCAGPITVTAAACVEAADSRVNCDFPATRKTLTNPCSADAASADAASTATSPLPTAAAAATPTAAATVRPAATAGGVDSLTLPLHPEAAAAAPAPAASTAPQQAQPSAAMAADDEAAAARAARPRPHVAHHHLARPAEVALGMSALLLLSAGCFLLVRRVFRTPASMRSQELLDEEAPSGVRYDKRLPASKV